jgi:chemotaxis response regulator CheB
MSEVKEQPYSILIADNHSLFREDLRRIISEKPHLEEVGEVDDGLHIPKILGQLSPPPHHPWTVDAEPSQD